MECAGMFTGLSSRPLDKGGGGGVAVVSKIRGGQAPSPGSASVYMQFVDSELNG